MTDSDALKAMIPDAFCDIEYPGDWCLRGSNESDEPYLLEDEFKGKADWHSIDAAFLDRLPTDRLNFIELLAHDLAANRTFFEAVFGMAMTGFGPTYACTLTRDVDIGLQADPQEATRTPLPVIEVKDLEATLAAVTASGAPVTKPIFSFPGGRRFHFRDPGGNELAAMQVDPR